MNYAQEFQQYCHGLSIVQGRHGNNGNPLFPCLLSNEKWGIRIDSGFPLSAQDSNCSWISHLMSESEVDSIKDTEYYVNLLTWDSKESAQKSIDALVSEARKFGKLDWMEHD